jgi:4-hydroxy-3-methylbut-2-en-1-yl diphosphate synthase IspG/GcpE
MIEIGNKIGIETISHSNRRTSLCASLNEFPFSREWHPRGCDYIPCPGCSREKFDFDTDFDSGGRRTPDFQEKKGREQLQCGFKRAAPA